VRGESLRQGRKKLALGARLGIPRQVIDQGKLPRSGLLARNSFLTVVGEQQKSAGQPLFGGVKKLIGKALEILHASGFDAVHHGHTDVENYQIEL